jgi:UDP-galactopyranose mutase
MYDYLVVGAGLAGIVIAERIAGELKQKVALVEKKGHIGGNAYDCYNRDGILIHQYGPHIFHTNSAKVFSYLSFFTKWRDYEHKVLSCINGMKVPFPINLDTINRLYNWSLDSAQLLEYFEKIKEPLNKVDTSEDVVISQIGRDLFEKFYRGYTRKQWGVEASQLDASVIRRIPVRTNRDDRYFTDAYQGVPLHGYTAMFQNMLKKVDLILDTDYKSVVDSIPFKKMIYTGPIDYFFDKVHGELPYRSLDLQFHTLSQEWFQEAGTVNYPNDQPYTRITEFKHLTGQNHPMTTILYEYPTGEGEPYYPIPNPENHQLFQKYLEMGRKNKSVYFLGRLAEYRYYNMDAVVERALEVFESEITAK